MSQKSPYKRSLTDASYESPSKSSAKKSQIHLISQKFPINASSVSNSSLDVKSQQSIEIENKEKELKEILEEINRKEEERKKSISSWKKEIEDLASELGLDPNEFIEKIFSKD